MAENILQDKGQGNWVFCLYQPTPNSDLGPFTGKLEITKDFHCVKTENNICLVIVPSPNIAYVTNKEIGAKRK